MALKRKKIEGYGQIELNRMNFDENKIIATYPLDKVDFADGMKAENGMLLAIDGATNTLRFPKEDEVSPIGINYSSEVMRPLGGLSGRRSAHYIDLEGDFMPRLGIPSVGATFTSNCLAYDDAEYADDETLETSVAADLKAKTPVYATYCTNGAIKITKTLPTGKLVFQVTKAYTLADGQYALKFQVIKGE